MEPPLHCGCLLLQKVLDIYGGSNLVTSPSWEMPRPVSACALWVSAVEETLKSLAMPLNLVVSFRGERKVTVDLGELLVSLAF